MSFWFSGSITKYYASFFLLFPYQLSKETILDAIHTRDIAMREINYSGSTLSCSAVLEKLRLAQKRAEEPPHKKARTSSESEGSKFSGVGAVAEMLAEEKERIAKELAQEEEKVRRKEAEKVLRKGRRRGDPNNPTKEEVEAAQELEALTWQVVSCTKW